MGRSLFRVVVAAGLLALVALAVAGRPTVAQEERVDGALLLVMDASGSMNETDAGVPLIDGAKVALNGVVDALPDQTPVGLMVYGSQVSSAPEDRQAGCRDIEMVLPIGPLEKEEMRNAIDRYEASGWTPIGRSLQRAADELPSEGPRTVVLVSDGEDTCAPPPPCDVARRLIGDGVDLRVETVGFFLGDNEEARNQLRCIAEATGGEYHDAESAADLADELETITVRAARQFQAGGEQVTGGPSAGDAPMLEPGTYQDTILPDESLWYAVELREGEELVVNATLGGFPELPEPRPFNSQYLEIQLVDPTLEDYSVLGDGYGRADGAGPTAVSTSVRTGGDGTYNPETEPGTYYVRVALEDFMDEMQPREFPLELTVEVAGSTIGTTGETTAETTREKEPTTGAENTTSETTPTPTTGKPASAADVGDDRGPSTAIVLALAVLTVLVLGLGGTLAVVLLRR